MTNKPLTENGESLGVTGECVEYINCHRMAKLDPTLNKIINVWDTLPDQIKKAVEAICLQPKT